MKIDIFSRVGLYVTMETGGEKREESVQFIYGVHPLLPGLNEQLKGLEKGQSTTYTLNHGTGEHPAKDPIRLGRESARPGVDVTINRSARNIYEKVTAALHTAILGIRPSLFSPGELRSKRPIS